MFSRTQIDNVAGGIDNPHLRGLFLAMAERLAELEIDNETLFLTRDETVEDRDEMDLENTRLRSRIAELEQQLAARPAAPEWEPLPDDEIILPCSCVGECGTSISISGAVFIALEDEDGLLVSAMLPDDYAVCRRRPQEPA